MEESKGTLKFPKCNQINSIGGVRVTFPIVKTSYGELKELLNKQEDRNNELLIISEDYYNKLYEEEYDYIQELDRFFEWECDFYNNTDIDTYKIIDLTPNAKDHHVIWDRSTNHNIIDDEIDFILFFDEIFPEELYHIQEPFSMFSLPEDKEARKCIMISYNLLCLGMFTYNEEPKYGIRRDFREVLSDKGITPDFMFFKGQLNDDEFSDLRAILEYEFCSYSYYKDDTGIAIEIIDDDEYKTIEDFLKERTRFSFTTDELIMKEER